MKADLAEQLRQEWRRRLDRILDPMLDEETRKHLDEEVLALERREVDEWSGTPEPGVRKKLIPNWALRKLRGGR